MEIASNTHSSRYSILLSYSLGLADPSSNRSRLDQARPLFDTVTPEEAMILVDSIMKNIQDINLVKIIVTRMLHSFTKSLTREHRPFKRDFPVIEHLLERNDTIQEHLDTLKPLVTRMNRGVLSQADRNVIHDTLEKLGGLTDHYTHKELVLFPVIERYVEESRCVQLMWAIHDDIRKTLKLLQAEIIQEAEHISEANRLFGQLFFDMRSMVFREEQVLLPAVLTRIPKDMLISLSENQQAGGQVSASDARVSTQTVDLITGNPTAQQLIQIFNNLPVDITLVDAQDKVVYFNTPEHRIFPRTKAVVGRSVQNCHPPKSMHIVQQILDSFRAKRETSAEFRITVHGRYIRITYQAIYSESGDYEGTLEVSQDITEVQRLKGEKRLLDWDETQN